LAWYIDVIIKLIEYAGNCVDDQLWYRVCQMVTGFGSADEEADASDDTLKKYAALKMFDCLGKSSLHESLCKIAAYVLSEFGSLIADEAGKSHQAQF
jgi:hypothetical protein